MSLPPDPGPQTIDQVTARLAEWAVKVASPAQVSLAPPEAQPSALEVNLCLLDVARKPSLRGPGQTPLQVWLRYLVSAWGPDPVAAHSALHQLVFGALARPDLDVPEDPVPAALWSAYGVPPRPAFMLRCPLRVEPYDRNVPLVSQTELRPLLAFPALHGRLVVPNVGRERTTMALSGARVKVSGTQVFATSDRGGFFRLERVLPGKDGAIRLSIQAKGRTYETTVHETGSAGAPVEIEVPWPVTRLEGRLQDQAENPISGTRIELPGLRQYVNTRADGRFVLNGLPASWADPDSDQIAAHQAGEPLKVTVQGGVVVLTSQDGASGEPVVIQLK